MHHWCSQGLKYEIERLKVLVIPPERMAALLVLPDIVRSVRFHLRCLLHGRSEVLFRVPPIRVERFEAVAFATFDERMASRRGMNLLIRRRPAGQ